MRFSILSLSLSVSLSLFLCSSSLPAQDSSSHKALAIQGRWNGTSLCVDKATDRACRDEVIVYDFDTVKAGSGAILQRAFRYVGKDLDLMGELTLTYTDSTRSWSADFSARTRIRWTYHIEKNKLLGTLIELPSNRLIRRVEAVRDSTRPVK